jgi:hypothetical protein
MYQTVESLGQSADMDQPGAEGYRRTSSGMSFANVLGVWNSSTLHPTISVERAPSYATQTAENLSKSSFFSGTPLF